LDGISIPGMPDIFIESVFDGVVGIFIPLCVVSCGGACAAKRFPGIANRRATAKPKPLAIELDDENIFHPK
jgi:hypothetical protein